MLDRVNFPFGWACPAGHVEENETPEEAMIREVKEEVNIDAKKYNLILHEFIADNVCKRGAKGHDFFVYEITDWDGEMKNNTESKDVKWMEEDDVKNVELEAVWKYFIEKLNLFG